MMHSSCKTLSYFLFLGCHRSWIPAPGADRLASQPAVTLEAVTGSQPRA